MRVTPEQTYDATDADAVIAAALRLLRWAAFDFKAARLNAEKFSGFHSRGSDARDFWRAVADAIADHQQDFEGATR